MDERSVEPALVYASRRRPRDPATGRLADPLAVEPFGAGKLALKHGDEVLEAPEHLDEAAEVAGDAGNFVYRGTREGEDVTAGLVARAPGTNVSLLSHVAGKRASPWISTTRSVHGATQKYGKHVVGVDLSKVSSEIVDLSRGISGGGRLSNWAKADFEVLIRDFVPPEALFFLE